MLLFPILLAGLVGFPSAYAGLQYAPDCCAADRCFEAAALPPLLTPVVSEFCEEYIKKTLGTVTKTTTIKHTATIVPPKSTVLITHTDTTTNVVATSCSTTVTTSLTTMVNYPTVTPSAVTPTAVQPDRRGNTPVIPEQLTQGCHGGSVSSALSSACSCFLTSKTTTKTQTSTVTVTASHTTITKTTQATLVSTSTTCTSTSTIYSYNDLSCGIASPTLANVVGQITCTSPAPPGETNGRLRIEGGSEGTIFEDCVSSGPEDVTTPSGGTHECDGTNDDANPDPGATATTQLSNASEEDGFPFDGSYDDDFNDFFITSISQSTETATQFWGLLQDFQFTPTGGCQTEISTDGTQETLWAFDAFNAVHFLELTPEYQVVNQGVSTVQVTVTDGSTGVAVGGASIEGGSTSDASGVSIITVPSTPGCYQFKATAADSIRSNTFYLTVLPVSS